MHKRMISVILSALVFFLVDTMDWRASVVLKNKTGTGEERYGKSEL